MRSRSDSIFVRKGVRCEGCGSLERHRFVFEYLSLTGRLTPPKSVLHLAPERCLSRAFYTIFGEGYLCADNDTDRYKKLRAIKLDLCHDLANLAGRQFDILIHNHVIEHLRCNYSMVLLQLQRMVKPGGVHIFTVPFMDGGYRESFADQTSEERTERFGQYDHYRVFSPVDVDVTLGRVLPLPHVYDATSLIPADRLAEINIPRDQWRGFNNNSLFVVHKQ